jgi:pimeloyl-ACP methyl ester carboxylesterase
MTVDPGTSRFISAQDGLKLHVQTYGDRHGTRLPVVCLPGLTRTAVDFKVLATALSMDSRHPRHVLAIDYRGRGLSDYDRDPANYNPAVELGDVLSILTALDITAAIFIGTSRGGILTMLMASARPKIIAGAVLNDIGPVIEARGLARIKSYVGKLPQPRNFEDAADIMRRVFGQHFPKLEATDWTAFAQRAFKEHKGRLVPTYDVKIATTLAQVELDRPLPALWKDFDALARAPLMVIRGANSDLLSAETVAAMQEQRPDLITFEVADQGHAPLLVEDDVIGRIAAFAAGCDPRKGLMAKENPAE